MGRARLTALLLALVILSGCHRSTDTSGPVPNDIYVWQRVWTPAVAEGISQARESMQLFVVFAGQITLTGNAGKVARPEIDYQQLQKAGTPVGLALRVDSYAGPFRSDDSAIRSITQLAREQLADARRHGIEPVELHFDFDCAESKLDGYRTWLKAVREAVKPLPVFPTVLPSWLKHDSFAQLAKESGQFILQVHCVEPPRSMADISTLTNPERAGEWVKQAARCEVPFRVALPTYTYLVAFDQNGKPNGVSAEGPSSSWPKQSQVMRWAADPDALADLIARWTRQRPSMMRGIIWYRLPISSDSFNWRWITLKAVSQGRRPTSDLRIEASPGQPSDLVLKNYGERDEPLPELVETNWDDAPLTAVDALAGYELLTRSPSRVVFRRKTEAALSRLSPGSQQPIGWIRCEKPAHLRVATPLGADRSGPGNSPDSQTHAGDRY